MAYADKLYQASFRNVPFFSTGESENGGKKLVEHNYPGSDLKFYEELGDAPPTFSISALVHGENADQERRRLILAMIEPGLGTLVHPIYGTLLVEAIDYSVKSSDKNIGIFEFTLNFGTSEQSISLNPEETTSNQVSEEAQQARVELDNSFVEAYEEPSFIDSVVAVADEVNAIVDEVNDQIDAIVEPIQEAVSEITTVVATTRRNVLTVVRTANNLKNSLRAVYDSFLVIVNFPRELREAWDELTNFDFLSPARVSSSSEQSAIIINSTKRNTAKRIQINNNNRLLADHTRVNALIGLIESTSNTNFTDEEQLQEARDLLESKFVLLVEEADRTSVVFNPVLRARINVLRNLSRQVLDSQLQNVWRVKEVQSGVTSLSILTHRYYGSLDSLDVIKRLNPSKKWDGIQNENVKVTTGGTVS